MIKVNLQRRTSGDRRNYSPHLHIPERRILKNRRKSGKLADSPKHMIKFEKDSQDKSETLANFRLSQ
jgi:hypothetical protein